MELIKNLCCLAAACLYGLFACSSLQAKYLKPIPGYYLELGVNQAFNVAGHSTSNMVVHQLPKPGGELNLLAKPSSIIYDPSLSIGAGYRFSLPELWTMSIGMRYFESTLRDRGSENLESSIFSYQFRTHTKALTSVARLYRHTSFLTYFTELSLGYGQLTSGYYRSDATNKDGYDDATTAHLIYGAGVGAYYTIGYHLNLGLNVLYQNNGKYQLGERIKMPRVLPTEGTISQNNQSWNVGLILQYQF